MAHCLFRLPSTHQTWFFFSSIHYNCLTLLFFDRPKNNYQQMNYSTTNVHEIKLMSMPMIGAIGPDFTAIDHEKFKAKFGVTVQICMKTWNMIVAKLNRCSSIEPMGFGRLSAGHILYGLFFLKMYPTSRQATATLGRIVGRNQFQMYAKFVIRRIAGLANEVVSKRIIRTDFLFLFYCLTNHYSTTFFMFFHRFYGRID